MCTGKVQCLQWKDCAKNDERDGSVKKTGKVVIWVTKIICGCAIFALGFDLFLVPNDLNAGGLSGLAMIVVELTGFGSVGWVTLLANIPLFLIGWKKIGRKFFVGSLIGSVALSVFVELFELLPDFVTDPMLGALYGGLLCGLGSGLVFLSGASTGGADIAVRLLKQHFRHVPLGKIFMVLDGMIILLTAVTFRNAATLLYCGITLFCCSQLMDAVVYHFDYSKVALIVTSKYDEVAQVIGSKLYRGVTYLYGQGSYSGKDTKVILTAIKRQQVADLKELVVKIDPNAFIILQESHQVLGDGFARYSQDSL